MNNSEVIEKLGGKGLAFGVRQHELDARRDDAQRIVHLVRDAGHEPTQRGELLTLKQHFPLLPELQFHAAVIEVLTDPGADIGEHREECFIWLAGDSGE